MVEGPSRPLEFVVTSRKSVLCVCDGCTCRVGCLWGMCNVRCVCRVRGVCGVGCMCVWDVGGVVHVYVYMVL